MKSPLTLAICLLGIGTVGALSEPPRDPPRGPYRAPLLPRLEMLRVLGAGQRSLVTDYYWLQAIQAAGRGGESQDPTRYLDLFYYADLITDLDPQFHKVYAYAGNAIPTNLGRETWVNTVEARKILEKGVKVFPEDADLRLFLAYNLSYYFGEHAAAAEHLRIAATLPNTSKFVPEFATRMLAFNRRFDTALAMVEMFRDNETDPEMRQMFEERAADIRLEQVLVKVDDAIAAFKKREGRMPQTMSELVAQGDLPSIPADPMGGYIGFDPDGKSWSSNRRTRLRPPEFDKELAKEQQQQQQQQQSPQPDQHDAHNTP
ncbi:MAG: pilus assembly protein [Hyalangium sp.]|uniref:pilus assembly protein n=1 Tax=Hyalangium sp. TaxID=2028555 RepID=UPI003899CAC6